MYRVHLVCVNSVIALLVTNMVILVPQLPLQKRKDQMQCMEHDSSFHHALSAEVISLINNQSKATMLVCPCLLT